MDTPKVLNEPMQETCRNGKYRDFFDLVLTSPPYGTSRPSASDSYNSRYDVHTDTPEGYVDWTVDKLLHIDFVLRPNGCVLYNLSYSSESPSLIWEAVASIIRETDFMVADTLVWKKKSALPNNRSPNKLTRIVEFVFVLCRKSELNTFHCNKKVVSVSKKGQANYENIYNFFEAPNNDGPTKLNKATFSSEMAGRLLDLYAPEGANVYDPFAGTGTTGVACIERGMSFVGSEISTDQCTYARKRLLGKLSEVDDIF